MTRANGTRIGPYEVIGSLGAGGMGEVYRATDTNLGRQVAIKVLPDTFANDPERLARFEREARTLASLNHPNIAQIYGFEKADGVRALVMELVEGPTLADRIAQGPIPVEEALPIAKQIAEALEAAHEQGIIHRDLKPANIKLRPDGIVKVLDFGLAKALEPVAVRATDATVSPTITSPAMMTGVGVLLGTAAYMSPEQARGRAVDKRSDIWAFGCVLYEMFTGRRTFEGEDVSDTIAAVLRGEPDWSALPADLPPPVRALLQSCLDKNRRQRVAEISTALFVLDRLANPPASDPKDGSPAQDPLTLPVVRARIRRRTLLLSAGALAASILAGAGVWFLARPLPPAQPSVRFQILAPGAAEPQMLALSPDGRYLAFVANASGPTQVWIRPLDALEARALAGTEGATYPFWSSDGAYVGFFAQGKLKKVALGGGPPQILCDANDGRGGSWNRDGVIVFSAGPAGPIQQVAAAGGLSTSLTSVSGPDDGHRFPVFLPDGVHFLFNASSNTPERSGLYVASLDAGEQARRIVPDQTNALYLPPRGRGQNGYLVFRRESTLVAQQFDSVSMTLSGETLPIAEEVPVSVNTGFGAFSVAANGTVVYRTGGSAADRELVWVDATGKRIKPVTRPQPLFGRPGLSPDERLAAISIANGNDGDIWVQDLSRDVLSRLTFRPGLTRYPVWSPDGQRVAFSSQVNFGGTFDLYDKAASGNSPESLLLKGGINTILEDWSPDGRWLVFRQTSSATASDLWLLPLEGDRKPVVYLQTPFSETNARFAPGFGGASRWMAYASNESGVYQIYVQAIPATGAKYQVSTSGGTLPMWRSDAKELYFLSADQRLMAVPIAAGTSIQVGTPRELFAVPGLTGYAPAAGGQRFLANVPAGEKTGAASMIAVVLNWHEELKRLGPRN